MQIYGYNDGGLASETSKRVHIHYTSHELTLKDSPHPQASLMLGLRNANLALSREK